MNNYKKYNHRKNKRFIQYFLGGCIFLFFSFSSHIFSIGNIQAGFNVGLNPDINNLSKDFYTDGGHNASGQMQGSHSRRDSIEFYDNLITQAVAADPDNIKGTTLGYPIALTIGMDLRYIYNYLFIRMGFDYNMMLTSKKGNLTTATYTDDISYQSWNYSIFMTFGFTHSYDDYFQFYMGIGPYFSSSELRITHSAPKAFESTILGSGSSLLPYQEQNFTSELIGLQINLGIQFPVIKHKIYVSFDIIHYEGRSPSIELTGKDTDGNEIKDTTGDTIIHNGEKYTVGIQYYFKI